MLVCVGRVPNTQGLGLEKAGVKVNQRGFVEVDANLRSRTSTPSATSCAARCWRTRRRRRERWLRR